MKLEKEVEERVKVETTAALKRAATDHPVHGLIEGRFSPRSFAQRAVTRSEMQSIFEAARWAPSANNKQPWSFVYAHSEDAIEFGRILENLKEGNRRWAKDAAVLVVAFAPADDGSGGQSYGWHDLGIATGLMLVQATALGLHGHVMAGIEKRAMEAALDVPEGWQCVTAFAIGHLGSAETLPEDLKARELAPRERNPQKDFVFNGRWER